MLLMKIVLIAVAAIVVGQFTLSIGPMFWSRRYNHAGQTPDRGTVIFVEGIRWLNIVWDRHALLAGLRQSGFEGNFRYWRWHETWRALLLLPVIRDHAMLERRAAELAAVVAAEVAKGRPVYLVGCSCGGYLAIRTLELLPEGVQVTSALILAGAFSPGRDLTPALSHVRDRLVITASLGDWLILGLLTTISGTADGKHTPSIGMLGPRNAPTSDKLRVIRYDSSTVKDWVLGGHFTTAAMVRHHLVPAMKITKPDSAAEAQRR